MTDVTSSLDAVKDYYGRILGGTKDLKSNACRCVESLSASHRAILDQIAPEILERSYGCGSPIPEALEGMTVLDLGCGTGRDVYLVSRLVGPSGRVIGVDMTDEPLAIARRHQASQAERFGYGRSNVEFVKGYIEDLDALGIADKSIDVVISNCAINLSPRKDAVFAEIFRVLKPGGELHFSDVFAGRRVPRELCEDPVLLGECLGGAMYLEDFRRLLRGLGCPDYRTMSRSRVQLGSPEIEAKIGAIDFHTVKVRAFKLAGLEDICEDYGQVAWYLGTIPDHPFRFSLDDHHAFEKGKPMLVCGNTAAMVADTRFGKHFKETGDRSVHHGPFDCSPTVGAAPAAACGGSCC
jgi:SAM-dependent methyltransferase